MTRAEELTQEERKERFLNRLGWAGAFLGMSIFWFVIGVLWFKGVI